MTGAFMVNQHYDVIIIGGRCAGSSLALRLADHNLNILLVDRATFPSLPGVPSGPFVHPGTMRLIDELGIPESEYTHPGSRIDRFAVQYGGYFEAIMPTAQMLLDRNYFYGIDRHLFDNTFWKRAANATGVTVREGFAVTAMLKDAAGTVNGIVGKTSDGTEETFSADLVVGADGRFSFAARQFGAQVVEEQNQHTSAAYFADWENVDDYAPDQPNAIATYNSGKGFMLLVIPIAERKYIVSNYMRSADAHFGGQGMEQAYLESLQRVAPLWNRLKNARRVTDIVGMRPIENGYRQAYGANWALVGDAVHYKDPADGQGIYDALLETKLLAQAILDWKQNGTAWVSAGATYQQQMLAATKPKFKETVQNVRQTLYTNVPAFVGKTLVRWVMNNPFFQKRFLRSLSRAE
jgi:flavin-dependent dehydrogenase